MRAGPSTRRAARSALISTGYVEEQRRLHAQPQGYGGRGRKWAPTVAALRPLVGAHSVLDYGCGQGSLAVALQACGIVCREYDPAIPGKDQTPGFADLVVCTDVLEHVEPDRLPAVLSHLRALARRAVFLVINLRESNKVLADGRNAHLIIESADWWVQQLEAAGLTRLPIALDIPAGLSTPEKSAKFWCGVVVPVEAGA